MPAKEKEKERHNDPPAAVENRALERALREMEEERHRDHHLGEIAIGDVIKLLVAILTQVKDQPALQPRPLNDTALKAIDTYNNNRRALAHGPQ
jgi:hypothetical protein